MRLWRYSIKGKASVGRISSKGLRFFNTVLIDGPLNFPPGPSPVSEKMMPQSGQREDVFMIMVGELLISLIETD